MSLNYAKLDHILDQYETLACASLDFSQVWLSFIFVKYFFLKNAKATSKLLPCYYAKSFSCRRQCDNITGTRNQTNKY